MGLGEMNVPGNLTGEFKEQEPKEPAPTEVETIAYDGTLFQFMTMPVLLANGFEQDKWFQSEMPVSCSVAVEGLRKTQPKIFKLCTAPVSEAKLPRDLITGMRQTVDNLQDLGVFKDVRIHLEKSKTRTEEGGEALDLKIFVREDGESLGVEFENGQVGTQFRIPNLYGRAISAHAEVYGNRDQRAYRLVVGSAASPWGTLWGKHALTLAHRLVDTKYHEASDQTVNEVLWTWTPKRALFGNFSLSWATRSVNTGSGVKNPCEEVKRDLGEHESFNLGHKITGGKVIMEEGSMSPPVMGHQFSFINEVDLLSGSLRTILQGDLYVPLPTRFYSLGLHGRFGGAMVPYGRNKRIPIFNRFYLSNEFVRGFSYIGPGTVGSQTGGNFTSAFSCNLYPRAQANLFPHFFFNIGNSVYDEQWTSKLWGRPGRKFLDNFIDSAKASVGLGWIFNTGLGRLEVNLACKLDTNTGEVQTKSSDGFARVRAGLYWNHGSGIRDEQV